MRITKTNKIEFVETQNLVLALNRLNLSTPYDLHRVRRALYHAILLAETGLNSDQKRDIRITLGLP